MDELSELRAEIRTWTADPRQFWMHTFLGTRYFPLDPRPEELHLVNVAHHLAFFNRYGGALPDHYGVAQHCVEGCDYLLGEKRDADAFLFLWHDGAEWAVGDQIFPLKQVLAERNAHEKVERLNQLVMAERFGFIEPMPQIVLNVDLCMVTTEKRDLIEVYDPLWTFPDEAMYPALPQRLRWWTAKQARTAFLRRVLLFADDYNYGSLTAQDREDVHRLLASGKHPRRK